MLLELIQDGFRSVGDGVALLSRLFSILISEVGEGVIAREVPAGGKGILTSLSIHLIKVLGEDSYCLHC
jgi:hypothetical protein